MTARSLLLVSVFGALHALAHPPYEVPVGTFTRSDGVTISAVEHYIDGILGADPVAVQFRLADGSIVAETEHERHSVVVRNSALGSEVYVFNSDWLPFATRVRRFDGFSFTEISDRRSGLFSVLVHTRAHFRDYAVLLAAAAVLAVGWFAVRAIPKRDSLKLIRVVAFAIIGVVFALWLLASLFLPVSPLITCVLVAIIFAASAAMKRIVLSARRRV